MNSTDLLATFIEALNKDTSKESTTMETITELFKNVDIIMLPIFLILFIIIKIYNSVKDNKHFTKIFNKTNIGICCNINISWITNN